MSVSRPALRILFAAAFVVLVTRSENIPVSANCQASPINLNRSQMNWQKMEPSLGKASPERAVLHEDSDSHLTQFMIRMPKNFHVPSHWHHANETHTVISGALIIEEAGKRILLGPGGFNFTPATVAHSTSTSPQQGAVLFVTVDGPYDQFLADQAGK